MTRPRILVFAGSIRTGSYNARLAALATKLLALADAEPTRISLQDFPLPLFDGDLEAKSGPPDNAVKLKRILAAHEGVFIASPEYTASVTPLLKNAIDWVTRVRERDEEPNAAFKDRVFRHGLGFHSRRWRPECARSAAASSASRVWRVGTATDQCRPADDAFDDMDNLKDEALTTVLKVMVQRLIDLPSVMPKATE